MKYFIIIGASGSGKTSLAKKIASSFPELFERVVQCTTRSKRKEEENGIDYFYLSNEEFNFLHINNMLTGEVIRQFSPSKYGTEIKKLNNEKYNILVLSIEGLFNLLKKKEEDDEIVILNISSVERPDVIRDGRENNEEEKYNSISLDFLKSVYSEIKFIDIPYEYLKEIRNNTESIKNFLIVKGINFYGL